MTEDTDEARYDYEDITIFVRDLNLPPILESIGDKIVAELSPLEFTVVANDPEGDELIYSATNLPQGAVFDADTQIFTWTPGSRQSGSYENVRFQVSDGNSGGGGETEEPAPIGGETKLLLRFDANLDDSSSSNHVAQLHGNAALDDSVYNVGQGSLSLDGSEDYLDIPDSEDWYFGTNDFTVDFWVRLSSLDNCGFVAQKSDGGHGWRLHYEYGYVQFFAYTGSSGTKIGPWTFPWNPSEDTWYHLAFARGGNDFKCYVDDVEIGFVRTSANPMPDISAPLRVGAYPTLGGGGWSAYLDGNIDELRVSHADLYAGSNDNALAGALAAEVSSTSENTVYEDITITVLDLNHAPVLTDPGNKSVNEGETLQFTITATDPDGDTLTYALTNIQEGASFDSATRTFTWTPGYDQAGTTYLGITVSDGALTDYEEIYITVVDKNRAPILSPIGNKFIGEGATLLFTISATDTDEDEIIYSAEGLPAGAVFDSATQIFTWTPSEGAADTYEGIRFIASDGSLTDA